MSVKTTGKDYQERRIKNSKDHWPEGIALLQLGVITLTSQSRLSTDFLYVPAYIIWAIHTCIMIGSIKS